MRKLIFVALAAALAVPFLSGCTRNDQGGIGLFSDISDIKGIFSTRPQTSTHSLLLIKLQSQPLLTTLKVENGTKSVSTELAEAITTEQNSLIAKLNELSSETKVIYRYRLVLNGVAVVVPNHVIEKIRGLANVALVESSGSFARPKAFSKLMSEETKQAVTNAFNERNSVKFIGADQAHARGIRGQGIRVGIIDTGIDYTHAMFGGAGTEEAFKAIDPAQPSASFPNAKVIGGTDLAGTDYDSGSADFDRHIPRLDSNPIDEGGHGTHVAGTVAGVGDGFNTYDGVAPDALLYAIKVFGKDGSTGDATIIASLEYSADPNGDGDLSDALDVVNMSLGGGFGDPHLLYVEAIGNLSKSGTFVVASAGNSGDNSYIVGAPSVSEDALSVAASIDDMDHNWKFQAVQFTTPEKPEIIVEAIEAPIAKPIAEAGDVAGPLVDLGLADKPLTDAQVAAVQGKVAFIMRGVVTFADKIKRAAEAGAIGVVVGNNQPGEPLAMGGEGKYEIPAIMIKQDLALEIQAGMARGEVTIKFNTPHKIEKPQLIDTITGFSSKGPRSLDALVKPEIAAPGNQIVSAEMGGGAKGVKLSGTSMAAPHMAGVMALMKQVRPGLSSAELKSAVMGTATTMRDENDKKYPISRQGAGRVQVLKALEAAVATNPVAISLGETTVETRKTIVRTIEFKNISQAAIAAQLTFDGHASLRLLNAPAEVAIEPGQKLSLSLKFLVDAANLEALSTELDGFVRLVKDGSEVVRVPVLAVVNKVSQVKAQKLAVGSTSETDSQGASVDLVLNNSGVHAGEAYPFNLIGSDRRKQDEAQDPFRSRACDLSEAGYRVIVKDGQPVFQVAVKLYEPVTTWDQCEVSVLIDGDGDGIADQELVGTKQDRLKGLTATTFASLLLDAAKARELRKQFELDTKERKPELIEDYTASVLAINPMAAFEHSTVAIVEAPVAQLKVRGSGELAIRIATSYQEYSAVEPDDFLVDDSSNWVGLSLGEEGASYVGLPEKIVLAPQTSQTISFSKGAGIENLLVLYPTNRPVVGGLSRDQQAEILTPVYEIPAATVANH